MAGNPWEAGTAASAGPSASDGIEANQAFSVDTVFKLGWAIATAEPLLVFGCAGLVFFTQLLPSLLSTPLQMGIGASTGDSPEGQLVGQLVGLVISLLCLPFQAITTVGLLQAARRTLLGEERSFGGVLTAFWATGLWFVTSLLVAVIGGLVSMFWAIPAVILLVYGAVGYQEGWTAAVAALVAGGVVCVIGALAELWFVGLGLLLAPYAAAVEQCSPIDALQRSWEAAARARVTLFVLVLVGGLAAMVGLLVFCIGTIPVQAVYQAGLVGAWLLYARPAREMRALPIVQATLPELA